jgi:integrase
VNDESKLREEFEAFLRQRRERSATGAAAKTVRELWEDWQPTAKQRPDWRISKTSMGTVLPLETTLGPFGSLTWEVIDFGLLDEIRSRLATMPRRRGDKSKPLSPAYRNRTLTTLQSLFAWHLERRTISRNPLHGYGREDESSSERQGWFTEAQFAEYIKHAPNLIFRDMATLSYRCGGMRNSELRYLRKASINWDLEAIVVRAHEHKNRRAKVVPLTKDVIAMLKARCELSPSEWVFPSPRDSRRPVAMTTLGNWARKAAEDSGIELLGERPVPHHLRHTFAVQTLIKGANLPHVMDAMGISSMATMRRYSRMAGSAVESFREVVEKRLVLPSDKSPDKK